MNVFLMIALQNCIECSLTQITNPKPRDYNSVLGMTRFTSKESRHCMPLESIKKQARQLAT
jgi:hypothetical protein